MDFSVVFEELSTLPDQLAALATSPSFYLQALLAISAIVVAYIAKHLVVALTSAATAQGKGRSAEIIRANAGHIAALAWPLFSLFALGVAADLAPTLAGASWLVVVVRGIAALWLLHTLITRLVKNRLLRIVIRWTAIPIAMLYVFGLLEPTVTYLEGISITAGNIEISVYSLLRVLIFGSLIFWLGRVSSDAGQSVIRSQVDLDVSTRELFAKLFEALLYGIVFVLLLQVMGINLTTLALLGGALGVGLGFGLQAIASNYISGIILLLDRSIKVGDYVELEAGQSGTILQMNMRSTTLETFDGKIIVVPNESFISGAFTNWTHRNKKQRYSIEFQVSYGTDLEALFDILREVVASHPQVISGDSVPIEERPDAEIAGFGDSGVDILVEFWMEGIDDGRNRVGGDLYLMIWKALHEHGIEIPFPQREVRLLDGGGAPA